MDKVIIFVFFLGLLPHAANAGRVNEIENTYCERLAYEMLRIELTADTLEEYQKSWAIFEKITTIKNDKDRLKCYMLLLNYYIGEGNLEWLEESIIQEGKRALPYLRNEINNEEICIEKFKSLCRPRNAKVKIINELILEIENKPN